MNQASAKHLQIAVAAARRRIGWLLPLLAGVGCRDLDRFDTRNAEAYCGSLVGQDGMSSGFAEPEWVGANARPTLALTLRTSELFKVGGVAAVIKSNDSSFGPCGPDTPLFNKAKARIIGAALGDRLSSVSLGEDHEEDVLTYVDSTCSGSMVGIVSLIQDGNVELRLLRPAPNADGDSAALPETTARYGLFLLSKAREGCGF